MGDVREPVTGVVFPGVQKFWAGCELACLGAGARVKKVAMMTVKVYAVAMFVDAGAAARAYSQEQLPQPEAKAVDALQSGAFTKVLQMHMVRGITGKQFTDALDESLRPIMKGDETVLDDFCAFFASKKFENHTQISMLWHADGPLDVSLRPASDTTPYASVKPGLSIASPSLGQALWSIYLSPKAPSPDARKAWLAALPKLPAPA